MMARKGHKPRQFALAIIYVQQAIVQRLFQTLKYSEPLSYLQ
jgi:hypothetical protein